MEEALGLVLLEIGDEDARGLVVGVGGPVLGVGEVDDLLPLGQAGDEFESLGEFSRLVPTQQQPDSVPLAAGRMHLLVVDFNHLWGDPGRGRAWLALAISFKGSWRVPESIRLALTSAAVFCSILARIKSARFILSPGASGRNFSMATRSASSIS